MHVLIISIDFLIRYLPLIDINTLRTPLLEKNNNGWNILMLAARYHPAAFTALLNFLHFLRQHTDLLDTNTLKTLIVEKDNNGSNIWTLTARYPPAGFTILLEFLKQHTDLLNTHILKTLIVEKDNNGLNTWTLIARYPPAAFAALLEFITELRTPWSPETIPQLVSTIFSDLDALMTTSSTSLSTRKGLLRTVASCSKQTKDPQRVAKSLLKALAALDLTDSENKDLLNGLCHNLYLSQPLLKHFSACYFPDVQNLVVVTRALLTLYQAGLRLRQEQGHSHLTTFFGRGFGYSTNEKRAAAEGLAKIMEDMEDYDSIPQDALLELKQSHPAVAQARLGRLFEACRSISNAIPHPSEQAHSRLFINSR